MGADLYIRKLQKKCEEKWKPIFDARVRERDRLQALQKNGVQVEQSRIDKAQKQVDKAYDGLYSEGYFRDSYNSTNVLNLLGLSYWTDFPKYMNKKGEVSGKKLQELRDRIASAPLTLPTREELEANYANVDDDKNSLKVWHAMFRRKQKKLIKFLDTAIEMKEPIYCSI